ncbi:MAG: hypothetical protein ACE5FB_06985 [Candidatus Binatia bacterium]
MGIRRIVGAVTIVSMAGLVYPKDPKDIRKAKPPHTHVDDYSYRHVGESGQVTATTSTGNITVTPTTGKMEFTVSTPTILAR